MISLVVQVLTVNGGVVGRQNLAAKNGLVHEVDRVLFPPTVGDLLQTLQVTLLLLVLL
jgi:uncharacterized surface protein with fasciclin (FAS1) repeats